MKLTITMCIRSIVKKNPLGISPQKCLRVTLSCCAFIVYCARFVQGGQIGVPSEKSEKIFSDLIYMLLWTPVQYHPFNYFGTGQEAFIKNNCSYTNCFVTRNRQQLASSDAIAFNGYDLHATDLPVKRYAHQKYIYFMLESAQHTVVCNPLFDNFFNWTATYRFNSDIVTPYFRIKDWTGAIIGPKPNMEWKSDMKDIDENLAKKLSSKTKAVAWFGSNCDQTINSRIEIVKALQLELTSYRIPIDIYGRCGNMKCNKTKNECDKMVSNYYFYLSFENSNDEDYVTDTLLRALQQDAVPIVLGGADYSRFLPPGSYLQAYPDSLDELAKTIATLILMPSQYQEYFKWKSYYSYYDSADNDNICSVCAALNNQSLMKSETVYKDFRGWWYPTFKNRC